MDAARRARTVRPAWQTYDWGAHMKGSVHLRTPSSTAALDSLDATTRFDPGVRSLSGLCLDHSEVRRLPVRRAKGN